MLDSAFRLQYMSNTRERSTSHIICNAKRPLRRVVFKNNFKLSLQRCFNLCNQVFNSKAVFFHHYIAGCGSAEGGNAQNILFSAGVTAPTVRNACFNSKLGYACRQNTFLVLIALSIKSIPARHRYNANVNALFSSLACAASARCTSLPVPIRTALASFLAGLST